MSDKKKRPVPSFSPAQVIMREELLSAGGAVDEVVGQLSIPSVASSDTLSRYGEQQRRASQIALDIIDEYELVLSLKQWGIITKMVEQAILTGVQLEQDMGPG